MLVNELLETSAKKHPTHPAVWMPGGPEGTWRTYGEIDSLANFVASGLIGLGLAPGQCVGLLLDNSVEWIACHFGILKAGGVVVGISTDTTSEMLHFMLQDSEAFTVITGKKYFPLFKPFGKEWAHPILVWNEGSFTGEERTQSTAELPWLTLEGSVSNVPPSRRSVRKEGDMAALVYTSGSTGKPKGVMLSHGNLTSNMVSIATYLELRAEDRMAVVLPFYYIYGLSLLYTHFLVGASVLIENRFAYPNVVLDTIEKRQATGFAGVPSTFTILLQKSNLKQRRFPALRLVTQAGGSLPPHLQQQVYEAVAPARFFVMYGATEAAPRLTYVPPDLLPSKWGSIGKAIPGVQVFIADENGQPLPAGETGEIVARGPNIMMGYWKDPELTGTVLKNGIYFTGDLGRQDEDGCLYVTGRKREFIKVGGNRVSSQEVEEALSRIPGIAEAAVIGVEDELMGEAIKAFVVRSRDDIQEEEIRNNLKAQLPSFKIPKSVVFFDSLPKNPAGKVLKPRLREFGG